MRAPILVVKHQEKEKATVEISSPKAAPKNARSATAKKTKAPLPEPPVEMAPKESVAAEPVPKSKKGKKNEPKEVVEAEPVKKAGRASASYVVESTHP